MFHNIPPAMLERMRYLEAIDRRDREDGTPRMERLRQVPPETGRFIALLAATAPPGPIVEIGTSAGYSTLWLALACRETGRRLVTFEILPAKAALARETFRLTEVEDAVDFVEGDALEGITRFDEIAFCFLDAEKEIYGSCYDLVVPRLVTGGLLVADNAIDHYETLAPMIDRAIADDRVDAMVVRMEKGELVCRKH